MASYVSLANDIGKFSTRSRSERLVFLEAFIWLGVMRLAILMMPFQKIVSLFGLTEGSPSTPLISTTNIKALEIGWGVRAAAARTPWESVCLGQALACMAMLRRRGMPGIIYLGVSKDFTVPESIAAHAWLSSCGTTLTGDSGHERYTVLSSFFWP
jgi:hypothetical protein